MQAAELPHAEPVLCPRQARNPGPSTAWSGRNPRALPPAGLGKDWQLEPGGSLGRGGVPRQGAQAVAGIALATGHKEEREELRGGLPPSVLSRNGPSGLQELESGFLLGHLGCMGSSWPPGLGSHCPHRNPEGQSPWREQEVSPQQRPAFLPDDWTDSNAESFGAHRPRGLGPPGQAGEDWVQVFPRRHSRSHFCSALGAEPFCSETRPGKEK